MFIVCITETGTVYRFPIYNMHKVNIWLNIVWKCRIFCEQNNSERKACNLCFKRWRCMQETYCLLNLAQFACQFTVFFNFFQKSQVQSQISKLNISLALWAFNSTATHLYEKTSLTLSRTGISKFLPKKLIGWNLH